MSVYESEREERAVGRWCSLGPLPHLCHHGNRAVVKAGSGPP